MAPAFGAGPKPAVFAGACALLLLVACAPTRRHDGPPASSSPFAAADSLGADSEPAAVRTIFVIHGDAEYSWHDAAGKRHLADREAVLQAREAAARPRAEVVLFHLGKGRHGWFQGYDGTWEHYRGGRRVAGGTYSRGANDTALEAETALLRGLERGRGRDTTPPVTRLAYFGHEIPVDDHPGYFRRAPWKPFSQARFAQALGDLSLGASSTTDGGKPFETLVLSMCYGGNPALISALRPWARTVVASPAYLHLSYLDARALADPDARAVADTVAARSFARLSAGVSTEVTVAVYDLERARPPAVLVAANPDAPRWGDCARAPGYDSVAAAEGTRLWYRAPRFGAGRDQTSRGPWQCAF